MRRVKIDRKKTGPRPFTTDYGTTQGHCSTKESCLISAFKRVVIDKLHHVTLEDPNGRVMARVSRPGNGFWGILIEAGGKTRIVKDKE